MLILRQSEPYPYGWVRNQAKGLAQAGYAVTVVAPTGFGYDAPDETLDGVRALRYVNRPSTGGPIGYLREYAISSWHTARLALRAHRDRPVDAVIASAPPDFFLWLALPFRRSGAGIVLDRRDLSPDLFEVKFGRRGPLFRLLRAIERSAFRRADTTMLPNEPAAEVARTRGGVADERLYLVGNGPDPDRIFPVPERPELRRGKRFLVLWVGVISEQEGLDLLVRAIEILVRDRSRDDVAFAVVGPGDKRDAVLEDLRRRRLQEAVELPGVVTDDGLLRSYMATADVCLSVDEPNEMNDRLTMMKVLEYMAMGRPVVQTPLHEMRRLCGDAALYAAASDPADLANRIEEVLDNPDLRERLGRRGRERVLDGLMWPDQVPAMVQAVETARSLRAPSVQTHKPDQPGGSGTEANFG